MSRVFPGDRPWRWSEIEELSPHDLQVRTVGIQHIKMATLEFVHLFLQRAFSVSCIKCIPRVALGVFPLVVCPPPPWSLVAVCN